MPKGSQVHKVFEALIRKGMTKGKAARIAQSKTGAALQTARMPSGRTGRPPQGKK